MATHILECSSPELLPFARSRIKALRAVGLIYASQTYDCGVGTVHVRVVGAHDYISISGGGSMWVLVTLGVEDSNVKQGSDVVGDAGEEVDVNVVKTWLIQCKTDFSSSSLKYYGESKSTYNSHAVWLTDRSRVETVYVSNDVVKGRIGALTGVAVYGGGAVMSGGPASFEKKLKRSENQYFAGGADHLDVYDDSTTERRLFVAGKVYAGVYGSITTSSYTNGTLSASSSQDMSSDLWVRNLYHTNDDYALVSGKWGGAPPDTSVVSDAYFKIPFSYSGGEPESWVSPPDKLSEWPHDPTCCQGDGVDWGVWVGSRRYVGHPTTGADRGKLWLFEFHDAVPHLDPPMSDNPAIPPFRTFDIRKLPCVAADEGLVAALSDDYSSGGVFELSTYPGSASYAAYVVGRKTESTGDGTYSTATKLSISVRVFTEPPRKSK